MLHTDEVVEWHLPLLPSSVEVFVTFEQLSGEFNKIRCGRKNTRTCDVCGYGMCNMRKVCGYCVVCFFIERDSCAKVGRDTRGVLCIEGSILFQKY